MKYEIVSADCHIDLVWLPPDLFTANAPAALRDRMPYVAEGEKGPVWVSRGGGYFGLQNGMGSAGRAYVPGRSAAPTAWPRPDSTRTAGRESAALPTRPSARGPDRDGVQGEVLYGILGAAQRLATRRPRRR